MQVILCRCQKSLKFFERFCFLKHLSTFSLSFSVRLFLTENMVSMCFCSVLIIMYTFVFLSKTICALARLHLQHRTKTHDFRKKKLTFVFHFLSWDIVHIVSSACACVSLVFFHDLFPALTGVLTSCALSFSQSVACSAPAVRL